MYLSWDATSKVFNKKGFFERLEATEGQGRVMFPQCKMGSFWRNGCLQKEVGFPGGYYVLKFDQKMGLFWKYFTMRSNKRIVV